MPPKEAARRWRLFVRWHVETGRKCVRVLESGGWHGRWHYHCVTPERWKVDEVREAAERYGFGRINVKRLPANRAHYVAKYLGKQNRGNLPPGQRRWACVGFEGVPVNRVEASSETRHLPKTWEGRACTHVEWVFAGREPIRHQIRKAETAEAELVRQVFVSAAEADALIATVMAGAFIQLGEYRGLSVTKRVVEDPQTGTRIESTVIEHVVEFGAVTQTVTEWLPAGAEVESVALPAQPGTAVLVLIKSLRQYLGQEYYTGVIKPLLAVAESHTESQQPPSNP